MDDRWFRLGDHERYPAFRKFNRVARNMNQEPQQHNAVSQFSLIHLFTWVTLFSLIVASVISMPVLSTGVLADHAISATDVYPSGLTWVVLLVLHVSRRAILAIAVHAIPVLVMLFCLVALQIDRNSATGLLFVAMICSSLVSFLFAIASLTNGLLRKHGNSISRCAYQLLWVTLLSTFICAVFPSFAYGRIHFPAVIFGATIGVWAGLYQSIAATKSMREINIVDVSVRYVVLAGLIGSVALPIINEVAGRLNGLYLVQPKFNPIAGLLAATVAFFALWISKTASSQELN